MIIWTELIEQMNPIVEKIRFNTNDYWGSTKGLRFRARVESYAHTVELQADEDRLVKTEFDITVHGYILPDTLTKLEKHHKTTNKAFTPKKMVMGMETVARDFNLELLNQNREKWRNKMYPNLQEDVLIPGPPVSTNTNLVTGNVNGIQVDNSPQFLRIVPVPLSQAATGHDGDMSYDSQFFYLYVGGWRRFAISSFVPVCSDNVPITGNAGTVTYNSQFLYIYSGGTWRKDALSTVSLSTPGTEGDIMYDTQYLYIYTGGSWRSIAIASF